MKIMARSKHLMDRCGTDIHLLKIHLLKISITSI
jgi:hypothetical protein